MTLFQTRIRLQRSAVALLEIYPIDNPIYTHGEPHTISVVHRSSLTWQLNRSSCSISNGFPLVTF
jgi:hypothetical protein